MKTRTIIMATMIAGFAAAPACANHLFHLGVPYASRGECEAAVADFGNDDADVLLAAFPNYFDSHGDVASFLARAFPCEKQSDGNWYIQDDRREWLGSEWFSRK